MKRKVLLITIVACFSTLAVGRYAYAQPPWAMGGGPPGMMPGMWGGPQMPQPVQASITGNPEIDRRVQFYEGLMRQMDTNQDGTVSKEEISQARMGEYLVSRMKERAGVDVSGGFRIDELRQKVIDYYKQRYGGDSQSGQSSSGSQSSTTSAQSQQTVSILRLGPNVTVPGFGTPTTSSPTTPTVPGFGSPIVFHKSAILINRQTSIKRTIVNCYLLKVNNRNCTSLFNNQKPPLKKLKSLL